MNKFWKKECWQPPHYTGFKILAVALALLVWAYVTITENPLSEAVYTVPVEIRNLSEDLAQPETNYQVQVRVQGTFGTINALSSHDLVTYIDLSGVEAGEATPQIEIVDLPEGVSLVSLSPQSIQLSLEPKVSETFTLELKSTGEPAANYKALEAVLSPELITVSGSATHIEEVTTVFVSADISGADTNYTKNLSVEVLDEQGNNISQYFSISPSVVSVMIPIVFDQPESTVAVRAVTSGSPALGYQVSRIVVEPSAVRVFSDLTTLDSLYYLETETIDISDLKDTTSFTAKILHGNNVTLGTESVTVVVQIEPVATATVVKELIYAQNLAEDLVCNVPLIEVSMVLTGPDTAIESLNEADVVPYVDCSTIDSPGEYTMPISVSLPASLSLAEIMPVSVTIQISEVFSEEEDGETEEETLPTE